MLSVLGSLSVASPAFFLPSFAVLLSSVSGSFPCPSCLCLPLRTSFSRCPCSSRREGAAASSVLALRTFIVLEANDWHQPRTLGRRLDAFVRPCHLDVSPLSVRQFFCGQVCIALFHRFHHIGVTTVQLDNHPLDSFASNLDDTMEIHDTVPDSCH